MQSKRRNGRFNNKSWSITRRQNNNDRKKKKKKEREHQAEIEARKARKLNEKYMVVHSQMTDQNRIEILHYQMDEYF